MLEGLLIALEGMDGAGTTSAVAPLAAHLRACGHQVTTTFEPSDGPIGRLIRQALRGECSLAESAFAPLFAADRLDHLQRVVHPALTRGDIVISDRYLLSSLVYQVEPPSSDAWVRELNKLALPAAATLYFKVTPQTALLRRKSRGGPTELFEKQETQKRVHARYQLLCEGSNPELNILTIDAEARQSDVWQEVCAVADALIATSRKGSSSGASAEVRVP